MTNIESILLIMIASGYLVLLIFAIVVAFTVIKILHSVRRIAEKAEYATENVSETVKLVAKKFAPMAATAIAGMVARKVTNRKRH